VSSGSSSVSFWVIANAARISASASGSLPMVDSKLPMDRERGFQAPMVASRVIEDSRIEIVDKWRESCRQSTVEKRCAHKFGSLMRIQARSAHISTPPFPGALGGGAIKNGCNTSRSMRAIRITMKQGCPMTDNSGRTERCCRRPRPTRLP
jgi:hypothetical protein